MNVSQIADTSPRCSPKHQRLAGLPSLVRLAILSAGLQLAVTPHATAQQIVTNFGKKVTYDHGMTVYDTIDRNAETITEVDRVTPVSAEEQFQTVLLEGTSGNLSNPAASYEMGSFAEGSTTFDMKTSSSVYFEAMEQGSFDPETAPDGVWDYMTAYSHTTSTYYDSVKIVGPADETGDPTVFRMHWQAKANKLIFSQSALEISTDIPSFGDIDLGGGLSRLDNGYFTNVNYEVTMNAFANQQLQTPTYSVEKLEPFLPPVQGDSLPLDETKNLDDIDLIYEVPAQVNIPFVLQVDLAALMDVELFVTSTATPTIFSRLDLTQTFDSVAFDVLDEFGNVRNDVTIESQIGIDYAGAAPTAVPEPSGALMLLIVMTALAGTKRYCRQTLEVRG